MASLAEKTRDLSMRIGFALSVWQRVEEQHYHLFLTLLGLDDSNIPAIVYFSTESFDARRTMVDRMFQDFPSTKELRTKWNDINKNLKDHSKNRNKLAHYKISHSAYADPDQPLTIRLRPPALKPSPYNRVSQLLGYTPDNQEHNLGASELNGYIKAFSELGAAVCRFNASCMRVRARPGQVMKPPPPMIEVSPPPPLSKS
jgi:hypothetical protein